MAIIQSGATTDLQTIDPTSKAARVTLYDSLGNRLLPDRPTGAYIAGFNIRHTAADAAASAVVAMRNPAASSKTVQIRSIRGVFTFDGTAAAATSMAYEIVRFNGGDPTTGTTMPRIKKRNSYAASQVLDANAQYKSGILTITSGVFETPFHYVRMSASVTNAVFNFDLSFSTSGLEYETFELAAGEGIAIRLTNAAIIGQGLSGSIEFDER